MTIHSKHRPARTSMRKTVFARASALTLASAVAAGTFAFGAPAAQADSVWDRVAACESGGNWNINTGNGYYGGLQFSASTWSGYGGNTYAPTANLATKSQQITIAKRVLAGQGAGAWPTCSVQAGLTRSNGGASSSPSSEPTTQSAPEASSAPKQSSAPEASSAPTQSSAPEASSAPAPTVSSGPVTRYVSADKAAYIRSGPSYTNSVIDKAARGTKVSGPVVNGWVKISEGRYIGNSVLSSSEVTGGSQESGPSTASTTSGTVTRYVSADIRAYVRSGPSYDNAVVDKVDRGTAVTGEWHNGWLKIGDGQYIGNTMLSTSSH